jgi:hypothetical protein
MRYAKIAVLATALVAIASTEAGATFSAAQGNNRPCSCGNNWVGAGYYTGRPTWVTIIGVPESLYGRYGYGYGGSRSSGGQRGGVGRDPNDGVR